jgi:trimeric autotransporter adhesin
MTYVSALEAQAEPGIVSGSTTERKQMSTKTIYKRIALVAVAALGAGVLSVAPASATGSWAAPFDITTYESASATTGASLTITATQVAGADNYIEFTGTATTDGTQFVRLAVTGGVISSAANATLQNAAGAAVTDGTATVATYAADYDLSGALVRIPTKAAGTIVVSVSQNVIANGQVTSTEVQKYTVTVSAAGVSGVPSAANSTAAIKYAAPNASAFPTTDATATTVSAAATTAPANIYVLYKDGSAGKVNLANTVDSKVTAAGPCVVQEGITTSGYGKVFTSGVATSDGVADNAAGTSGNRNGIRIDVKGDGTGIGGACVVTIEARKDGATAYTTVATKTITFFGTVASLSYTALVGSIVDVDSTGAVTGNAEGYAAVITAKDAGGNAVTMLYSDFTAPTAAQKATADVTDAAVVAATAGTYGATTIVADVPVLVIDATDTKTGVKSLTLTHTATGLTVTVPFTVGLARATTAVLTTDKATYLPGEKITLTLTLKDAGGFATADNATGTDVLATGGITANVSLVGDTTTATAVPTVGGKKTWTLYAPLSAGPIVFSGKTGTSATLAPATAVTLAATATVSDSASMQSLTTLINSLIAKINALSKLVTKIQKKVRA